MFDLFGRYGGIDFARASLRELVDGAVREFEIAYRDARPSHELEFLRALIPYLAERDL